MVLIFFFYTKSKIIHSWWFYSFEFFGIIFSSLVDNPLGLKWSFSRRLRWSKYAKVCVASLKRYRTKQEIIFIILLYFWDSIRGHNYIYAQAMHTLTHNNIICLMYLFPRRPASSLAAKTVYYKIFTARRALWDLSRASTWHAFC